MTVRCKVVAANWTAYLALDEGGTCIEADPQLKACLGHAKGALRTYFAQQKWTATILVPKAGANPDPAPIQVVAKPPPGVHPPVMSDPMVQAILAAFPGAVVRPRTLDHQPSGVE